MSHENFQQGIDAAKIYESQKVAAIFRSLAQATIDKIEINDSDKIIDVACGIGIVREDGFEIPPGELPVSEQELKSE